MESQHMDNMLAVVSELQQSGEYGRALALLTPEAEANPDNLILQVRLADARRKAGDIAGALEVYRSAALAWAERGALTHAVALNKLILSLDPASPSLLPLITLRYLRLRAAADRIPTIPHIPLFEDFSPEEMAAFLKDVETLSVEEGQLVVREGEAGQSLMIILRGTVHVITRREDGTVIPLAVLGPGDFFGERSILDPEATRSAWIAALTDVELLVLSRTEVLSLVERHPNVGRLLNRSHRSRVLDTLLARMPILADLPAQARARVAREMTQVELTAGSVVFSEGDESRDCYVVGEGAVEVTTTTPDGDTVGLALLTQGDFFGEAAALNHTRRTATVLAQTDVVLYRISSSALEELLAASPEALARMRGVYRDRMADTITRMLDA